MGVWIEIAWILLSWEKQESPLTWTWIEAKEWRCATVIYIPFYVRENFTFFSPCVKYVFDFHRPPPPSFSGFFASFWCRSNVGRCRSFANLSQKSKNFLRVPFSALPSFRGDSRWRSFPYLLYRENFTFFLACVKYTYECHRLSLPSFSGFFALFLWRSVTVALSALTQGRGWKRCV